MTTEANLKEAFAGESRANRTYAVFAEQAEGEGFKNVAKLYRAASEAEAIHARRLLRVQAGVGSTVENLRKSVEGETHEFKSLYPAFIKVAEEEKKSEALIAYTYAMKAEEVHADFYKKAMDAVQGKRDLNVAKISICTVCGNIFFNEAPEKCPICGVFKKKFQEVP
ncbi:MAG: rubrerythrin family protein [Methanomicrobiales archaeon]|nr:rubrerythrin family protein [Methanomicrobiales archaeon]